MPGAGSGSPATRPPNDPQSALVLQPRFGRSARQEVPGMTDVNEAEGWAKGLDELAGGGAPRVGGGGARRRLVGGLRGVVGALGGEDGREAGRAGGGRPPG